MVAGNAQCGFLSQHSGGTIKGYLYVYVSETEKSVYVCASLFTCVWECKICICALVCGLTVVHLLDNNEGFIFGDKTLE